MLLKEPGAIATGNYASPEVGSDNVINNFPSLSLRVPYCLHLDKQTTRNHVNKRANQRSERAYRWTCSSHTRRHFPAIQRIDWQRSLLKMRKFAARGSI